MKPRRWLLAATALGALGFAVHEVWLNRSIARSLPRHVAAGATATAMGTAMAATTATATETARARRSWAAEARRPAMLPAGRAQLTRPLAHGAFMRRLADDACACTDRACSDAVNRYYAEHLGLISDEPDDAARAHDEELRAIRCTARFINAADSAIAGRIPVDELDSDYLSRAAAASKR